MIYRVTRKKGDEWIPLDGRGVTARMMRNIRHYSELSIAKAVRTRLEAQSRRYDVEDDHLIGCGEFRVEQCPEDWTPVD